MTDLRKAAEMALDALEVLSKNELPKKGAAKVVLDESVIPALRQALAQPEQEPVAWMHNFIEGTVITHEPADIGRHPDRWTPLYTAPPKREWVGLTDEERFSKDWQETVARAEVKLKEKST